MKRTKAFALVNFNKQLIVDNHNKTPYIRMEREKLLNHRCVGEDIIPVYIIQRPAGRSK